MLKPSIELILASLLWGFAFVAIKWTMTSISVAAMLFYRFAGAAVLCALILSRKPPAWSEIKESLRISFWAGLLLAATIAVQAHGLQFTTVSKSSFITILYVIIVPFLEHHWLKQKISPRVWLIIPMALVGVALMVDLRLDNWNKGDSFTLVNSFTSAIHITYLAVIARKANNLLLLAFGQSLWTAVFCLVYFPFDSGSWNLMSLTPQGWIGITELTIGASFLAFFFQIRAQKVLPPTIASILFLLESPVSSFFGVLLLGEVIGLNQILGAGMIIAACAALQFFPREKVSPLHGT